MMTQAQILQRTIVQPSRVHDYLYDPHFVLSDERDHARASFMAKSSNQMVKRLPIYNTMFSELRHHPRMEVRIDMTDPVPPFVSRQFRGGRQEQTGEAVMNRFFNSSYDPGTSYNNADVSGANRYKYFRRPMIPFAQSMGPMLVLSSARQDTMSAKTSSSAEQQRALTPAQKTIETQTDYRESEAQTDPYSPDYVVKPGSQPELLTLAMLSYEHGLPAGLAEVEMIERARAKRAWEATLPPLNDMSQLDKRRRMMEEQERNEWALREQEIDKLQEARLKVLVKLLQQREEQHEDLTTKRLDRIWSRKQLEKREEVVRIRNDFMRAIRKLTGKKSKVEGKLERRNITTDYSSFGSQAFAPLTRIGVFIDRLADQFVVKNKYLTTYDGLVELENSIPDFLLQPVIKPPKRQLTTASGFVKRKYRQEMELEEIHKTFKDRHSKKAEDQSRALRLLQKVEKPVPRPLTPTVDVPTEKEEERELAAIFLQQLLRGRSVQNVMYEGKEKRIELIRELRSTHALQEAGQQEVNNRKAATLILQRQQQLYQQKESAVDEALASSEGETLGDTLDFLNKELVRLQEERKVHAFSILAERQRRIKEAEESGTRQVEERRRREEDEIFKQVVKVHQTTVNAYLEDVICATLNKKANEQARDEIQMIAEKVNDAAYEMESIRTDLESEEIVAELVYGFLLPAVQKETIRNKVHKHQRKYLNAAHKEIHASMNEKMKDLNFEESNKEDVGRTSSVDRGEESKPDKATTTTIAGSRGSPTTTTRRTSGDPVPRSGSDLRKSSSGSINSGGSPRRSSIKRSFDRGVEQQSPDAVPRSGSDLIGTRRSSLKRTSFDRTAELPAAFDNNSTRRSSLKRTSFDRTAEEQQQQQQQQQPASEATSPDNNSRRFSLKRTSVDRGTGQQADLDETSGGGGGSGSIDKPQTGSESKNTASSQQGSRRPSYAEEPKDEAVESGQNSKSQNSSRRGSASSTKSTSSR